MDQYQDQSGQSQNSSDEGQSLDWSQALAEQQAAFQKQGQALQGLQRELGESKEVIGKIKRAFSPDDEKELDPHDQRIAEYEQFMDYYLQKGLEAERSGQKIPLTVTNATKLAQLGIESERRAKKFEQEIAELKRLVSRQQNPNYQGLERAAYIMEGMVDEALEQMYGQDQDSSKIRSAQFNAVTARVNEEIKDLMKNDPDTLIKIQRDPKKMRTMVNYFMTEMLPPKVRSMMEEQEIMNSEMSVQELYSAFAEAKKHLEQAERSDDARAAHEYSRLMDSIRQDILAAQYGGQRSTNRPSLNRLLTGTR
jgi:hypothetical protein